MRSVLALIAVCCLLGFATAADVSAEVDAGALTSEFEAQVQGAISQVELADEVEDESEDEVDEESEAEEEVDEEGVLADLDAAEAEIDNAEADSIESDESVEELESEVAEFEQEVDALDQEVDAAAESDEMRLAQTHGFGDFLKDVGKAALKGAVSSASKEIGKKLGNAADKLIDKGVKLVKKVADKVKKSDLGKAVGNLFGKAKDAAKKAVNVAKKIIKDVKKALNGKDKKKDKKQKQKKADKKKQQKKDKKKQKKQKKDKKKKVTKKKDKKKKVKKDKKKKKTLKKICRKGDKGKKCRKDKKCAPGRAGKKCRKERCKGHKLGCRWKCKNGQWSRRHRHKSHACRGALGGVMEPQPLDEMNDDFETKLDIEQGVLNADGTPGPALLGILPPPPPPKPTKPVVDARGAGGAVKGSLPGAGANAVVGSNLPPAKKHVVTVIGKGPGPVIDKNLRPRRTMWNGVDPRYRGKADLPPVPRLPEDVEDCVACEYVWKQVEQDVGNSAITQTIYDSFHANAVEAQRTPIFYPACQTMFDAADDMIADYMDGFTVTQVCENSMLCRPRDLSQFLKYQRKHKGI